MIDFSLTALKYCGTFFIHLVDHRYSRRINTVGLCTPIHRHPIGHKMCPFYGFFNKKHLLILDESIVIFTSVL
jgi:hypothetical protein